MTLFEVCYNEIMYSLSSITHTHTHTL